MIKRHYIHNIEDEKTLFPGLKLSFSKDKSRLINSNRINSCTSVIINNDGKSSLSSFQRSYLDFFYTGILLQEEKSFVFTSLFYFKILGFLAYKANYNISDDVLMEMYSRSGEIIQRSLRMHKLLEHSLLDYIKTAILLRDTEAKTFYASIESRKSIPDNRMYLPHEQDLEQLLIFLCANKDEQILSHLQKMQSFDYISYIDSLPYTTYFFVPYIKQILIPSIEVFLAIFGGKKEVFNKVLQEAILQHKVYYEGEDQERDGGSRRGKPEGWVSLLLSCACMIADEKGFERTISSDYLPEWLIKGDFEGLELSV